MIDEIVVFPGNSLQACQRLRTTARVTRSYTFGPTSETRASIAPINLQSIIRAAF